jgi:hypothetical protein
MLCMSVFLEMYHVFRCMWTYCQFHLNLYGSSNSVLIVLRFIKMHVIYIYIYVCVYVCVCMRSGIARPVGGWGRYNLVSELSEVCE